jgi:tetratricopeptide (TPR) repeat protein
VVVVEVRELVTRASAVYFNGDSEASEELLIRAATRWSIVSTTPNPEIAYWLSLARGALSLQSGRVIPETAPLYKSMSQLLTSARKNYEQGLAAINEGRRNEGMRKLKQAKELLYEVRILFPINHDAGILDLRIDQLLDPENFERVFNTRFTTAVAETKRGSREAYADMQNLSEIRPDFPGMRRALYQAEIDIGLRQPPADTTAATRSTDLARRAQTMLNNPEQHAAALELVNEALRINPNSTLAMDVKDRLQVAMARQNVAVIDRTTEQEYIRAVSELQRGNTIIAMSIVQKLLQNPNNRNSVKINELLRRIEAML